MQQQADEEQSSSDQRNRPNLALRPTRVCLTEAFYQREYDQRCDDEPGVMKADFDSRNLSEFDIGAHLLPFSNQIRETRRILFLLALRDRLGHAIDLASAAPYLRGDNGP